MEYVEGETLQPRPDRIGPLRPAEAARLGREVALGLAAAHDQGLVHRDVKPANVLLDGGPEPAAKLTDFGLARAADDASLTRSGVLAGTPLYMAPEQARGDRVVDHRADLFSLGSVLYTAVAGRPPFRAPTAYAVLRRVAEDAPRPLREVTPGVPPGLAAVAGAVRHSDPRPADLTVVGSEGMIHEALARRPDPARADLARWRGCRSTRCRVRPSRNRPRPPG